MCCCNMSDFFKDATICTFVLFLFLFKGTHYETSAFFFSPLSQLWYPLYTLHDTQCRVCRVCLMCLWMPLCAHTPLPFYSWFISQFQPRQFWLWLKCFSCSCSSGRQSGFYITRFPLQNCKLQPLVTLSDAKGLRMWSADARLLGSFYCSKTVSFVCLSRPLSNCFPSSASTVASDLGAKHPVRWAASWLSYCFWNAH